MDTITTLLVPSEAELQFGDGNIVEIIRAKRLISGLQSFIVASIFE